MPAVVFFRVRSSPARKVLQLSADYPHPSGHGLCPDEKIVQTKDRVTHQSKNMHIPACFHHFSFSIGRAVQQELGALQLLKMAQYLYTFRLEPVVQVIHLVHRLNGASSEGNQQKPGKPCSLFFVKPGQTMRIIDHPDTVQAENFVGQ